MGRALSTGFRQQTGADRGVRPSCSRTTRKGPPDWPLSFAHSSRHQCIRRNRPGSDGRAESIPLSRAMTRVTGSFGRIVWMPTSTRRTVALLEGESPVRERVTRWRATAGSQTGHRFDCEAQPGARDGPLVGGGRPHAAARRATPGVQRMVVTHAMNPPIAMNVAQIQEAGKLGAFIEFVGQLAGVG